MGKLELQVIQGPKAYQGIEDLLVLQGSVVLLGLSVELDPKDKEDQQVMLVLWVNQAHHRPN